MERESNYIEGKFQNVLRNIFQFDASDLDFGIYRILNYKRNQIEKFINEDLKNKVEEAFSKYKKEQKEEIDKEFEKIKKEIAKLLGEDAFTLSGELKEEFKNTPLGKEFLSLKDRKEEIENIEEIKRQVFIDLYNFFSRYYEEGDFIPQLRYSIKGHKYVIPYNGEEVKLYWANYDQYYIKTGLFFRDYTFKAGDYKVIFRVVSASQELGSNKEKKSRFFILSEEDPIQINNSTLIVRFQYRELENDDKVVEVYRKKFSKNKSSGTESDQKKGINQNKLNIIIEEEILNNVKESILNLALKKEYKKDKEGSSISLLLYHLNRFTAKNTRDFFIHKNLKKFLSEQLDYFIKSEVLDIEILEKEKLLDKHITRAKVVRDIGGIIIDFLSQIEEFQKRLWEKKKFVIKTEYVITTDRVPEDFYDEIWKNKEQKKEWQELGFEIPKNKEELKNKKLPVDTKYFSQEFKERLLENLTKNADLDDLLDGILIKSENWQALNLLLEKYKEKVQVVYIDPPYNTGSDEFLYKDRYQHSSWLTMMENRLRLARELMREDGVIFVSIDDNEFSNLYKILSNMLDKFIDVFIIKSNPRGNQAKKITASVHEYVLVFGKTLFNRKLGFLKIEGDVSEFNKVDDLGVYREIGLRKRGAGAKKEDAPNLFYPIYYNPQTGEVTVDKPMQSEAFVEILPRLENGKYGRWRWSREVLIENLDKVIVRKVRRKSGIYEYDVFEKDYLTEEKIEKIKSIFDEKEVNYENATEEIKSLNVQYRYPKPTYLIRKLIKSYLNLSSYVFDFFAGSGTTAHAVMKLNKEDGGKRKFILVEMADYFDTVIIPRIKKVAYSFNWKDGKPQDMDGIGVFFKYHYLEQFEDTLDNIEFKEHKQALELFKDEYLLKYFLDFETRESPYFLNIEQLKNPFAYKLKVNLSEVGDPQEMAVDIPETFNYLLGVKLKKIKARYKNGRKYLFTLGEIEGKSVAVVWREYDEKWKEEDYKNDKEFINEELNDWKPQIVYVNGQSVLTNKDYELRYIEPEFKKLMER